MAVLGIIVAMAQYAYADGRAYDRSSKAAREAVEIAKDSARKRADASRMGAEAEKLVTLSRFKTAAIFATLAAAALIVYRVK